MAAPADEQAQSQGLPKTLISMRDLRLSELPSHPQLKGSESSAGPDLQSFVQALLDEGHAFITDQKIWQGAGQKNAPPAKAPVEITKHSRTTPGSKSGETWFQRTSLHENKAEPGTATFEEFDSGLRENHSKNEQEYTPGLVEVHEVLNYNALLEGKGRTAGRWQNADLYMMQMRHKIPTPLKNRVFTVIVAAGKIENEFVDVQIPVEIPSGARYKESNAEIVHGVYASVERGSVDENGTYVKWQMATASDAKGILPPLIQRIAMPGEIAKDVGRFVEWRQSLRK
ncbi:hypothetical protein AC579_428 [Pseudocercospora musae]|uniref:DUF3074 domain-containing protein n=1 Tax=Pseudocercospora musae TaxID=113226 RepID=A0A139I3C4_9PEZI|nr:hypothetical protein AC579_428 [Pseudocercospora musae]KXT09190.1 hypothetical protein AC579_428 [Pseudocercospora musae]KXT09191.1 hypothetical protein AC579_428 [Pseudocercospora musae]KXT09192.1 hypothetical protein AC579_428 [Pseudocercospora musae]